MSKKRKHRKPVGESGILSLDPKNGPAKYEPILYGQTKTEIEDYILEVALASAQKQGLNLYDLTKPPKNNTENDFDYTLYTSRGKEYLDLMEVAPLEETPGSYADAPGSSDNGEMAEAVWKSVTSKSKRYGTPIHLLLYSTDWRFHLGGDVCALLALAAVRKGHVFASIAYYSPHDQESGTLELLYPSSDSMFNGFDEVGAGTWISANLNLSKSEIQPDGSVELVVDFDC